MDTDLDQLLINSENKAKDSNPESGLLESIREEMREFNSKIEEEIKKILEMVHQKVNLEDAESINNLLNELWERFHELEKASGNGNGQEKAPPRLTLTSGGGSGHSSMGQRANNGALKEISEKLALLEE